MILNDERNGTLMPALRRAGMLAAGIGLCGAVVHWISAGDTQRLIMALLGSLVVAIAIITLDNWRAGLYLFLFWLVFEDLPRKYLGNPMALYFAKDVLAAIAYVAFAFLVARGREPGFRPFFLAPLALFAGLGAIQIFNPASPSILYGLLGVKLYFYYVPLLFLGFALIRSEADLERFLIFNLVVGAVVAGLGIAQAVTGPAFLNPSELPPELNQAVLSRRAPVSGVMLYRPSSVFASAGRLLYYVLLVFYVSLGAAAYLRASGRRSRSVAYIAATTAGAVIFLSGSRGTLLFAMAGMTAIGVAALCFGPRRQKGTMASAAMFLLPAMALLTLVFPEAVTARWDLYTETLTPAGGHFELPARMGTHPLKDLSDAFEFPQWPTGYGIGTTTLGRQYLTGLLGVPSAMGGVESGYANLLLEMGIGGPILWLAWTGALIWGGWRIVRRLAGTRLFSLGFSILSFAWCLLIATTVETLVHYQNFVVNAYLWLLLGILFRLPRLAHRAQA